MNKYQQFINNKWVDSTNSDYIEVINPATEEVEGYVSKGSEADAQAALEAASIAQKSWRKLSAAKRADYILAFADALEKEDKRLGKLLAKEQGKLHAHGIGEVHGTCRFLRYAAESARRIEGEVLNSDQDDEQLLIARVPYGVVVALVTWNYPLALAGRKMGNALVTGNTMVLMPPLDAPMAVLELGKIAQEVLPEGVLNIVTGEGPVLGNALVKNPLTSMVTLTGGTPAGVQVAKAAADNLAVVSLELGGKTPYIVLEDADIDRAVDLAVMSGYGNSGQICTSTERVYVQDSIYDTFVDKMTAKVKEIKLGDPFDETSTIGPKVNKKEVDKCDRIVSTAIAQGAKVVVGGNIPTGGIYDKGFWFEPTLLIDVTHDMDIVRQETFGPIVTITKVSDYDEALELANDCEFGLVGCLFTNDYKKIMRAIQEMEVGGLYINRNGGEQINGYHAGIKMSGLGGEDGKHGLELYSHKKAVYLNYK